MFLLAPSPWALKMTDLGIPGPMQLVTGKWQWPMCYAPTARRQVSFSPPQICEIAAGRVFRGLTRTFRRSFGSGLQVEQMSEPANELDGNSCVYLTKGSRITTKHKACCIPKSDPLPELLPPKSHGNPMGWRHPMNLTQGSCKKAMGILYIGVQKTIWKPLYLAHLQWPAVHLFEYA